MSKFSPKEVESIVTDMGAYIDTAAAAVGLGTAAVKEFQAKVPIQDLLDELRKFFVADLGPAAKQFYDWLWELHTESAVKYAELYNKLAKLTDPTVALPIVLQQMVNDKQEKAALWDTLRNAMTNTQNQPVLKK